MSILEFPKVFKIRYKTGVLLKADTCFYYGEYVQKLSWAHLCG